MHSLGSEDTWPGLQSGLTEDEYVFLQRTVNKQPQLNQWFTKVNVQQALVALGTNLKPELLEKWVSEYAWSESPQRVGIIMAGNIPLVGFHDWLCVLVSGHVAVCKMSSEDNSLLPALVQTLIKFQPELSERIELANGPIGKVDAVIATGSGNSLQYFESYFGHYPHIFRKNRTSVAVLDGMESKEELAALGHDIFDYFGLGCRNVSHMLVPENYDFQLFFESIFEHGDVINHFKYGNNYDYNKTVYLMNQHALLDNNFLLVYESRELFSPLAMIYYHRYQHISEVEEYLNEHSGDIQAVIGHGYIPFGAAQCPALDDYADGVDTMEWLTNLNE